MTPIDGVAVVYCDGAFQTTNGKTAHGLVRFTDRYRVAAVIDRTCAGQDAGTLLDRGPAGIPIVGSLAEALATAGSAGLRTTHFVIGIAPDGGRFTEAMLAAVREAIAADLHVDAGLHDFLTDYEDIVAASEARGVRLRDVRRPPPRKELHAFTGKIEQVTSMVVAVLGTDSAVGKRTTAWMIVHGFRAAGRTAEMVGTGQTAWLQGARFSFVEDALISDFMAGEIEHATWSAWNEEHPDVIVVEGQGGLLNPGYPGGYEIVAAARPDVIVLQHAPARKEYDGFPGYPIQRLPYQIDIAERISGKPVGAITLNHEGLDPSEIGMICKGMSLALGIPVFDVVEDGPAGLVEALSAYLPKSK